MKARVVGPAGAAATPPFASFSHRPRGATVRTAVVAPLGHILVIGAAAALAGPVAAGVVAVAGVCLRRALRRGRQRRRQVEVRARAEDFLASFAAELDAGVPPGPALRAAAGTLGDLGTTVEPAAGWIPLDQLAVELTGTDDPGVVLCRMEAPTVRQLGIAYQVCTRAGARLSPAAAMLAALARADAVRAGELSAALAGPRASGRLVAALPVAGITLGSLAGAAPLHALATTPGGIACLVVGGLADLAGLRWLRAFADGVERRAVPVALDAAGSQPRASPAAERSQVIADLPLALDLIAVCLRGGSTVGASLAAVGTATGGALGRELCAAASALGATADVTTACASLIAAVSTRRTDPLARLLRRSRASSSRWPAVAQAAVAAFERAQASGARPAAALTRLAERARDDAQAEIIAAARRAGVLAVAPLGLCFLPAFLLLGVVPVVLGSLPGLLPA
ncbi:type II secretion system F family protein [Frankia sp. AgKG'84/4]